METQNLLLTRGRLEILRQHAFGTPSGTEDFNSNSSGTSTHQARVKMSKNNEISEENIVLVTADQLNEEQKADMAKLTEQFPAMYLQPADILQNSARHDHSKIQGGIAGSWRRSEHIGDRQRPSNQDRR